MKITFYNPPVHYYSKKKTFNSAPLLGLPILTRLFRNAGHEANTVDMQRLCLMPDYLKPPYPDVIGFSSLTINQIGIKDCITTLKDNGYDGMIVVGGVYATMQPEQVIGWGADLVVTGECDGNVVELIESGATGIHKGVCAPMKDIPTPDWDNHTPHVTDYNGMTRLIGPKPAVTMWTRSCPFHCIFCANVIFGHQPQRYRPIDNIVDEMIYLKEQGADKVFCFDDELVGSPKPVGWLKEIADRLEPMKLKLGAMCRCSKKYIDKDVLSDARRAGFITMMWGVESLNDKILKSVKRANTVDDIFYTLRLAKEAGIYNTILVQVGQYQETDEDAAITCDNIRRLTEEGVADAMRLFVTQIYEGSEMEEIAKREGWYKPDPTGWRSQMEVPGGGTPWMNKNRIKYWFNKYREVGPERS
jgi:radical SAM superfamily enzyme YgiQ (UPF0313 family)